MVFRDFAPPTDKDSQSPSAGVQFQEEEVHTQQGFDSTYSLPSPPQANAPKDNVPISPLLFHPHVPSKGRPRKKRCGMPQFNKKSSDPKIQSRAARGRKRKDVGHNDRPSESTPVGAGNKRMFVDPDHTPLADSPSRKEVTKRGRGRPKGSKNKPKKDQVNNKKTICEICPESTHLCSKCSTPTCNLCIANNEEAEDKEKRCCKQCA